ncbi:MAG: acyltransferase [Clostridiales bacterium]|nr:acyltransferase [Clostridiales bacterium]
MAERELTLPEVHPFSRQDTNICKGVAILMMYVHHLFYSSDTRGMEQVVFWLGSESQVVLFARACKLCVAVFVFLTAYGTTLSYGQKCGKERVADWFAYSRRRYFSLMTGFWIVYADSQIISFFTARTRVSIYGESPVMRWFYTILDALGLADAFGTPTYNATWWYMSLAVLLVFCMPPIIALVKRLSWSTIPIAILVPRLCEWDMSTTMLRYLLVIIVGVLAAEHHLFERLLVWFRGLRCRAAFWCFFPVCVAIVGFLMWFICKKGYASMLEAPAVFLLCFAGYAYLSVIPLVKNILAFLGKHSMNMFLTHTLIKAYFFNEFSYSFGYPELILLVLVADTLVLSLLLEGERKLLSRGWTMLHARLAPRN